MTDDIEGLITEVRLWAALRNGWNQYQFDLGNRAADALESEHRRADDHAFQEAGLRDDIGNLVQECDALRATIQEALGYIDGSWLAPFRPGETGYEIRSILSRAIDTKEDSA